MLFDLNVDTRPPPCLVRRSRSRNLEIDAAVFVLLRSGLEVQIHKRDLVTTSFGEIVQSFADDGVIFDFRLVSILEDQNSFRLIGSRGFGNTRRRGLNRSLGSRWLGISVAA